MKKPTIKRGEVALLGCCLFVIIGVLFFTGIHNIDNAWNMKYIEGITGMSLWDCTLAESCYEPSDAYGLGLILTWMSFALALVCGLVFGYEFGSWKK